MPPAEVDLDESLVSALLADQHPDLAHLRLHRVANGWDNQLFRLGDDLVVRMPRRAMAAPLVINEHRWLPSLAAHLPIDVPVPLWEGAPGRGYPWSWSVCRWFEGRALADGPPHDPISLAAALGAFLHELHRAAPPEAPFNEWRGGPLAARAERTRAGIRRLAAVSGLAALDLGAIELLWESLWPTPAFDRPAVWLHGDLHPANLIVRDRLLVAVLDFGDLTSGDPATDLAVAWMAFSEPHRSMFRDAVGDVDQATWIRARGWALALAVAYLSGSADDPTIRSIGVRTLAEVQLDGD